MNTGARSPAGRAGRSTESASIPPADVPMTMASTRPFSGLVRRHALVPLLKDALRRGRTRRRPPRATRSAATLSRRCRESPLRQSASRKSPDRPILQLAVEVDEHVAAGHQLDFGEDAVGGEAVVRKHDVLLQGLVEDRPAVGRRVVVGEGRAGAGLAMVLGEAGDAVHVVDAGLRLLQRLGVDVRRVDQRAREQAFLAQENRERVRLFAGAAAGHPDFQRGVGAQQRDHLLAQRAEVRGSRNISLTCTVRKSSSSGNTPVSCSTLSWSCDSVWHSKRAIAVRRRRFSDAVA